MVETETLAEMTFSVSVKQPSILDPMSGQIKFSEPVNLAYLRDESKFWDMFDIYWYEIDDRNRLEFPSITIERYSKDNRHITFEVKLEMNRKINATLAVRVITNDIDPNFFLEQVHRLSPPVAEVSFLYH